VSSHARLSDPKLRDQIDLVEALAQYVRASTEKASLEVALVRLARRLTEKWELSDPEALRTAGKEALAALVAVKAIPQ
jgi:hypothetical protein